MEKETKVFAVVLAVMLSVCIIIPAAYITLTTETDDMNESTINIELINHSMERYTVSIYFDMELVWSVTSTDDEQRSITYRYSESSKDISITYFMMSEENESVPKDTITVTPGSMHDLHLDINWGK